MTCLENAIAVLVKERNRTSVFYAASDKENLKKLLLALPEETYIERFHEEIEDELCEVFEEGRYKKYAEYVRVDTPAGRTAFTRIFLRINSFAIVFTTAFKAAFEAL